MRLVRPSLVMALLVAGCGEPEPPAERGADIPLVAARQAVAATCVTPLELVGTEDLNYTTNGYPGVRFRPPSTAYASDAAAALSFLTNAKPVQMTSEPFTHPDVVLNGGWLYNSGSSHRGLEYSRSSVPAGADPTFAVRAMADGIVRKVIPLNPNSPRGGNVVIIEHTVPSKPSTFSLYMHLRNGKTADRAAVQSGATVRVGVMIDPYGVYERESTSCYDTPAAGVLFPRHLMPYPPDFHGLDYAILSRSGSTIYAMGSYQRGLSANWRAALWYSGADFETLKNSYKAQNLRTREVSVAIASDGTPRYTAIWAPRGAGEDYILHRALTQAGFDADWQNLVVNGGYRVDDYFEYEIAGQRQISAGFTNNFGSGFKLFTGLSHLDEVTRIATEQAQGWRPLHLNIAEPSWRRALLFRPSSCCWIAQSALSASGYQSFHDDVVGDRGYRLYQVEGYDGSSTFAAVATRSPVNGVCP